VNNCICHYSPLNSEPDYTLLDGDIAKVDLGAHIDGYIAVVAHTIVVGFDPEGGTKVSGRKADVMLAAHNASEAALRLVKPGNESEKVTSAVSKIAESFKCKPIEGMLSHELRQNEIDGEKTIIQNPNEAQRKEYEKVTFEANEVYGVDVLISTGEGQGREMQTRVSVYKRTLDQYMLKLKTSRLSSRRSKTSTASWLSISVTLRTRREPRWESTNVSLIKSWSPTLFFMRNQVSWLPNSSLQFSSCRLVHTRSRDFHLIHSISILNTRLKMRKSRNYS